MIPRYLKIDEEKKLKTQIKHWHGILDSVLDILNRVTENIRLGDPNNPKDIVVFKLWLVINSTFRSVTILNQTGHFSDSFSILRILFETHLHLWNIINGDSKQAQRFIYLSKIQNWRIAEEVRKYEKIPELKNYSRNFQNIKREYESALRYFDSRPGKIPRNYTTVSNHKIALLIDKQENNIEPTRSFMFLRLYSGGSEYIHYSYIRIWEGFASVNVKKGEKTSLVLIPNPARGIETAWWASIIILDSIKWISQLNRLNIETEIQSIRNRILKLAYIWENGELR